MHALSSYHLAPPGSCRSCAFLRLSSSLFAGPGPEAAGAGGCTGDDGGCGCVPCWSWCAHKFTHSAQAAACISVMCLANAHPHHVRSPFPGRVAPRRRRVCVSWSSSCGRWRRAARTTRRRQSPRPSHVLPLMPWAPCTTRWGQLFLLLLLSARLLSGPAPCTRLNPWGGPSLCIVHMMI